MFFVMTGRDWTLWSKGRTRHDWRSRASWRLWNERRERAARFYRESSKCVNIKYYFPVSVLSFVPKLSDLTVNTVSIFTCTVYLSISTFHLKFQEKIEY